LWSAIHNRQNLTSTSEKVLLAAAIVLALAAVACAAGMLARSAFARRVLLVLASLIVLDQLGESTLADTNAALLLATYHAGVMILAVVALSSPTAAEWCIR
jgi:hypothetical protein